MRDTSSNAIAHDLRIKLSPDGAHLKGFIVDLSDAPFCAYLKPIGMNQRGNTSDA